MVYAVVFAILFAILLIPIATANTASGMSITVKIAQPVNGSTVTSTNAPTVSGTITSSYSLKSVTIKLDSNLPIQLSKSKLFSYTFTSLANKAHIVIVTATNRHGQTASAQTSFTVNYTAPTPNPNPTYSLTTGDAVYDKYDAVILRETEAVGWPDPMLFKAEIVQESDFQPGETTLGTQWASPCGVPSGWTLAEGQSMGLFQLTPACGSLENDMGVYTTATPTQPQGHPIMATDSSSPYWAFADSGVPGGKNGSLFNGDFNIHFAAYVMIGHYQYFKTKFPNCEPNQWMIMSQAAYASGRETVTSCTTGSTHAQTYTTNILARYDELCAQDPSYPKFTYRAMTAG